MVSRLPIGRAICASYWERFISDATSLEFGLRQAEAPRLTLDSMRFERAKVSRAKQLKFFEGAIKTTRGQIVLLAPARGFTPSFGWRVRADEVQYTGLMHGLQKLRGRIYLQDGALTEAQLTADGRHWQSLDSSSWHLLAIDEQGEICGCARYSHHPAVIGFHDLGVRTSALARSQRWGMTLRSAVERELGWARRQGLAFAEVGGWAISDEKRCTSAALRIALATYGLAQLLGGSVGLTTATVRHSSADILRRIGGHPLTVGETELPRYFDSQYQCDMEVLRFESAKPEPVFRHTIERLRDELKSVMVVAPQCATALPYPANRTVHATNPQLLPAVS